MPTQRVTAAFEVLGGTAVDLDVDTADMDPDAIADYVEVNAPVDLGLCYQCESQVTGLASGELVAFTVNGQTYARDESGHWARA